MIKKILTKIALAGVLMVTSASAYTDFIGDDFNGGADYDHKTSGSLDWVAPWVEFGDSNQVPFSDPTTGAIRINSNKLRFGGSSYNNRNMTDKKSIVRALDLEGKRNIRLKADFTYSYFTGEKLRVEMWDDTNSVWKLVGDFESSDR